ncbi:unnamed protein product [Absidia cylindrospora]
MARKQFDFTLRGKMPDLTVSLKEEHATYDITVMEVKPANVTNKDADLLKLGNMLKDSMDKLHKHGLTSDGVRVFGVLVEGYQCDLYVMDLDYTFVYLFYKFGTFYIPCNRYDFARLVDVVEHMLLWGAILHTMILWVLFYILFYCGMKYEQNQTIRSSALNIILLPLLLLYILLLLLHLAIFILFPCFHFIIRYY